MNYYKKMLNEHGTKGAVEQRDHILYFNILNKECYKGFTSCCDDQWIDKKWGKCDDTRCDPMSFAMSFYQLLQFQQYATEYNQHLLNLVDKRPVKK